MGKTSTAACVRASDIQQGKKYIILEVKGTTLGFFLIEVVSHRGNAAGAFIAVCHELEGQPYEGEEEQRLQSIEVGCPPDGQEWQQTSSRIFPYNPGLYDRFKKLAADPNAHILRKLRTCKAASVKHENLGEELEKTATAA